MASTVDARHRLNQMRRTQHNSHNNNTYINHNLKAVKSRKNVKSLTDLRELIPKQSRISNEDYINNNSVKNRLRFGSKYNNQKQSLNVKHKQKARISLIGEDERIPKVMVKLSKVEDNKGLVLKNRIELKNKINSRKRQLNGSSNANQYKPNNELNVAFNGSPLHSNRPIVPLIAAQTSVPTYIMTSSPAMSGTPNRSNSRMDWTQNCSNNTVIVSNLNKSITQQDINELFGEIGTLAKVSKINSSVALIVYENGLDAKNACQTYHNRLLDGMPMQCNILSHSQNAYTIDLLPNNELSTYKSQNKQLLVSQLRQINTSSQPTKLTAAQAFTNSRHVGNSNVRFTVNI